MTGLLTLTLAAAGVLFMASQVLLMITGAAVCVLSDLSLMNVIEVIAAWLMLGSSTLVEGRVKLVVIS